MPRIVTINIDGTGYDLGISYTEITATWTAGATTCTVNNSVLTARSVVVLEPPTNRTDFEALCAAEICMQSQAAGTITLKSLATPPAADTTFKLIVFM